MHLIIESIGFGIATGAVIALGGGRLLGAVRHQQHPQHHLRRADDTVGLSRALLINRGISAWIALAISAVASGCLGDLQPGRS